MQVSSYLDTAFEAALLRNETFSDHIELKRIKCHWFENAEFSAILKLHLSGYQLQVATGLVKVSKQFWSTASHRHEGSIDLTHTSLLWLMLHELSHITLGHFNLANGFGIAQRSSIHSEPLTSLPTELRPFAPLCLEMQADHEAADMLLGAYSTDRWTELRQRVLAISGMMMLIEREDGKNGAEGRTHPKAATRIFQLLGHVSEMPLIKAQLAQDASLIPPEEELQAFAHDVTIPCFFDAIQLAQVAEAASIESDLGTPENFFKDLQIAKLGDPSHYDALKTQGARQWAALWPCNEALKPILGDHFTT